MKNDHLEALKLIGDAYLLATLFEFLMGFAEGFPEKCQHPNVIKKDHLSVILRVTQKCKRQLVSDNFMIKNVKIDQFFDQNAQL